MNISNIIISVTIPILIIVTSLLIVFLTKYKKIFKKYSPIIEMDKEVHKAQINLDKLKNETETIKNENEKLQKELKGEYLSAKAVYVKLKKEISLLEENIEDISFGLYKPHYTFESSEQYKQQLDAIRAKQKELIQAKRAALCDIEWTVGGSKREGARMQKQYMKLMLRAFNGGCDAAVAKVTWNNVIRMEQRIQKSFDAINKLGGVMKIYISEQYFSLKLEELRLEFETKEKKHEEIEEQRLIKQEMREEEKALREAEKARKEAEQEEFRSQKALEKARKEILQAQGEKLDKLKEQMLLLEQQLKDAHNLKERATSMAQLTRSGHVYIISNIGSFGDEVLKIGMTRRLEPMDRVKELGDASVPFKFDVHAMIYSKDAPTLEKEFHEHFSDKRVNLVNMRKEYFFTTVREIEEFAKLKSMNFELTKLAEAKEYRESLSIKDNNLKDGKELIPIKEEFPDQLFTN